MTKVVVINGDAEVLELLEAVLEPGHYDLAFVGSIDRPYSEIRKIKPGLIILCLSIEDVEDFQIMTMLKLDPETRGIPLVTYMIDSERQNNKESTGFDEEDEPWTTTPGLRKN